MSELAGGAIGRATLYAKGATEDQAMAFLQPIVIDSHVLNNPWLNYSVYLSNTIIPGYPDAAYLYDHRLYHWK